MNNKPGLFIGIGGTGVKTLAHLKRKIRNQYDDEKKMLAENQFLFLDTDHETIDKIRKNPDYQINNGNPIPQEEFYNLGDLNPKNLYDDALVMPSDHHNRLLEWMIDQELPQGFKLRNEKIERGAGAQRLSGRTTIFKYRDIISNAIKSGVNKLYRYAGYNSSNGAVDADKVAETLPGIWVFASSNGGTGSSAIMDLLYIIDREYQIRFNTEPYLRLVLFMPEEFRQMNSKNDNYPLNAHATFWELDTFRKDYQDNDGKKFQHFAVKPDLTEWKSIEDKKWLVSRYILPVDTETEKGKKVTLEVLYSNTAEMCFYMHFGAAGGNAISQLDNDLQDIKETFSVINNNKTENWTKHVVAGGFKALVKPNDEFKEYLTKRFMYDLFEYGLLGFEFSEIHPDEKSQKLAKEQFANDYILKHLENIGASDENFEKYNEGEFDAVKLAKENEKSIGVFGGDDEASLKTKFNNFLKSIEDVRLNTTTNLNDSKHEWSRFSIIDKIQNDVFKAVEKSIEKYGIKYTEHLLFQVDDKFLEHKISEIEAEILAKYGNEEYETNKNHAKTAIKNKSYSTLNKACNGIKDFLREKTKLEVVKDILKQLCAEQTGLLETLRKAPNGTGLVGLETLCVAKSYEYKTNLHDLAKKYKKTNDEVFTIYLPAISSFVDTKGESTWKDGHLFEELYGEIVPLDATAKSKRKGNGDLGVPPIRSNSSSNQTISLESILKDIKNGGLKTEFFTILATQGKLDVNKYSLEDFEQKAQEYILAKIDSSNKVKSWMDQTLESSFNDVYKSSNEINDFKDNFISGIQLLFPRATQTSNPSRLLYAGISQTFAEQLGYNPNDPQTYSFVNDTKLSNRLMVFKFESKHSLRDYKYFDVNKVFYEKFSSDILYGKFGCHIHKEFSTLDISLALKKIKGIDPIFSDLVKLAYYDVFFKLLHEREPDLFYTLFDRNATSENKTGMSLFDKFKKNTESNSNTYNPILNINRLPNAVSINTIEFIFGNYITLGKSTSIILDRINSLSNFKTELNKQPNIFNGVIQDLNRYIGETVIIDKLRDFLNEENHNVIGSELFGSENSKLVCLLNLVIKARAEEEKIAGELYVYFEELKGNLFKIN